MSDSDDWENEVDAINEGKEEVKESKFADEDEVDSDEERKQAAKVAEEAKKNAAPPKVKNKGKDYDQMYNERHKKAMQSAADAQKKLEQQKLSAGAKQQLMSQAAEADITDELFATDITMDSKSLKSEQDYVKFAKQVGEVLYEG